MMRVPAWYDRVKRHPDYNDDRVILVDSMVFFAMVRGALGRRTLLRRQLLA